MSPEVGELDEAALDEAMSSHPDEALSLLADLTGATDPELRRLARRLAGRLMLDVARRGNDRRRGTGRIALKPFAPEEGDLDIDASIDALAEVRRGRPADPEGLRVRGWTRPGTALCVVLDRSGSMGGAPLAASAIAAAAVASRAPPQRTSQSYSGLPHSWPVSENASGGTPLTSTGEPSSDSEKRPLLAHTSAEWPPT